MADLLRWIELEDAVFAALNGETFGGVLVTDEPADPDDSRLFLGTVLGQRKLAPLDTFCVVAFSGSEPFILTSTNQRFARQTGTNVDVDVTIAHKRWAVLRTMAVAIHDAVLKLPAVHSVSVTESSVAGDHHVVNLTFESIHDPDC